MDERKVLKVLYYINSIGSSVSKDIFGIEFEEFANLLINIKKEGLIEGVNAIYADNTIYVLNIDDIRLTMDGIKYFNKYEEEIKKNILETLYANRVNKTLTLSNIRNDNFADLKNNEVEAYLNLLKDRGYVKVEKKPIYNVHACQDTNLEILSYELLI